MTRDPIQEACERYADIVDGLAAVVSDVARASPEHRGVLVEALLAARAQALAVSAMLHTAAAAASELVALEREHGGGNGHGGDDVP